MTRFIVHGVTWLGDAVMSLPTLASLRKMFPDATVDVLTKPELADLYDGYGTVSAIGQGYDVALVLPRSFRSALQTWWAGVPRRIGYAAEGRSLLLTDALPRDPALLKVHRANYYHHLLTALGTPPPIEPPVLKPPPYDLAGGPWVAIHAGATYGDAKCWFEDRFASVGRRLVQRLGVKVVLVGGPGEVDLAARLAAAIPGVTKAGTTSPVQLAGLLSKCALLLTNDTGPMHVADAVGTPVVAIFGPTDPATTSPYRPGHAIVRRPIECSPCLERSCPLAHHRCMKEITVDDVYEAAARKLPQPASR